MELDGGWTELNAALKSLRLAWEEVIPAWSDAVRQDFEGRFYAPLVDQVKAALSAIERTRPVLQRLREDCG
ncbi:MAG: hypothetical protein IT429_01770 [Gemmataceae bacterium]|nr:hypothetical protein [Gemmataceae bacterium]